MLVYKKTWFIIIMLILFFPIGLFLMWKYSIWGKLIKIVISIFLGFLLFSMISGASLQSASVTYMAQEVPAHKEKTEMVKDGKDFTTEINGDYIIGQSPSQYVSGEEKEFTTSQSGNYIAGEDFPVGTYDLMPVEGGGNVQGTDLNLIMGTAGGEFYTNYYDNKTFDQGDSLEVSGVAIKLIPQGNDTGKIEPGKYDLEAIEGGGNVIGAGINEIMGVEGGSFYVTNYDNLTLKAGDEITVSGVAISLIAHEKEQVVQEATEVIPAHEVTEAIKVDKEETETCYIDKEEAKCSELNKYDQLEDQLHEGE